LALEKHLFFTNVPGGINRRWKAGIPYTSVTADIPVFDIYRKGGCPSGGGGCIYRSPKERLK